MSLHIDKKYCFAIICVVFCAFFSVGGVSAQKDSRQNGTTFPTASSTVISATPLTPPKPVRVRAVPAEDSSLVYPEDVNFSSSEKQPSKPIQRRYAEAPLPKDIAAAPVSKNPLIMQTAGVASDSSLKNRVASFVHELFSSEDSTSLEGLMVGYTAETSNQTNGDIDPLHPPVSTASFLGVKPGVSNLNEVLESWGEPLRKARLDGQAIHIYSTEILNHIEIAYKNELVSSIIIRLDEPFPEEQVRGVLQTELLKSKPVLVPDENGKIVGEVFPEKGVLFLFSESENSNILLVRQIGIEPVAADPFVLRAEASWKTHPFDARRDLLDAIKIDPRMAKAYWILSQIEMMRGQTDLAKLYCEKAIRLDERHPVYHLALTQIWMSMNRYDEAKLYLEETLSLCDRYPHERARAFLMLGEIYRLGSKPDCETAIECHGNAIRIVSTLLDHPNPTVRLNAKDILFEAHLGAVKDVAWGRWDEKEDSIKKWITQAKEIATDPELVAMKRFSLEYPFKIAACSLACQVGMPENSELKPFVNEVLHQGDLLIQATNDPILTRKFQWETGLSIYDAVQIYQLRKRYPQALEHGELAAEYMEAGAEGRQCDTDLYLLARLYFRLGAIHAIGNKNHRAAIEWFDRAKPIFEQLLPKINPEELGRLGETLVSMGVSYWATGQREEAVRLTERGLRQIERGVKIGIVDPTAFAIPYSNLAKMHEELGNVTNAKHYARLASSLR